MLAMQYTIELAQDVGTEDIEARVAKRCHLFDSLEGLQHKSFLYCPDDRLYAPFYVWESQDAARDFLLNDLFKGVVDSFHRPRVRMWQVADSGYGLFKGMPTFARKEIDRIVTEQPLSRLIKAEHGWHDSILSHPALSYAVTALDADRWEWVRYTLWKDEASAAEAEMDCVQQYRVLHNSDPQKKEPARAA